MRVMILLAAEDIRKGRDPKHIIRDQSRNGIITFRDAEDAEKAGPLP